MINKAESWDREVRDLWAKNYAEELSNFLKDNGVQSILDTSGGTGYPLVEFAQMGWDVTYADSSLEMYQFFENKIKSLGLTVPMFLVKWQELDRKIERKYDALLCRGNSFIYMDGYDEVYDVVKVKENMKIALHQFYERLNSDGVLYIDLLKETSIASNKTIEKEVFFETYSSSFEITYDKETNIRINTETIKDFQNNSTYQIKLYSYVIRENELKEMFLEAGFTSVEKVEIESSNFTNSFLAKK